MWPLPSGGPGRCSAFDAKLSGEINLRLRIESPAPEQLLRCHAKATAVEQAADRVTLGILDHMLKTSTKSEQAMTASEAKHMALRYLLDAWEEAVYDGIDPDCLATAAIFAALSDMIATYGEEPVAVMCERLPERVRAGEFTLMKTRQ
jgi:predicted YcjX-like family ATPase